VRQPFNVNAMAQRAALAALEDAGHVQRTRELVTEAYTFLTAACHDLGLDVVPSCANFILVKVGPGREVFEALQKKSVIVRPMDGYGLPEYVRITFGRPEQNAAAVQALTELKEDGLIS